MLGKRGDETIPKDSCHKLLPKNITHSLFVYDFNIWLHITTPSDFICG